MSPGGAAFQRPRCKRVVIHPWLRTSQRRPGAFTPGARAEVSGLVNRACGMQWGQGTGPAEGQRRRARAGWGGAGHAAGGESWLGGGGGRCPGKRDARAGWPCSRHPRSTEPPSHGTRAPLSKDDESFARSPPPPPVLSILQGRGEGTSRQMSLNRSSQVTGGAGRAPRTSSEGLSPGPVLRTPCSYRQR